MLIPALGAPRSSALESKRTIPRDRKDTSATRAAILPLSRNLHVSFATCFHFGWEV